MEVGLYNQVMAERNRWRPLLICVLIGAGPIIGLFIGRWSAERRQARSFAEMLELARESQQMLCVRKDLADHVMI